MSAGLRDDSLVVLRAYCRGVVAGRAEMVMSQFAALDGEALAVVALESLNLSRREIRAIMLTARTEAELSLPIGTDPYDVRAIAARMVLRKLALRLVALDTPTEETRAA